MKTKKIITLALSCLCLTTLLSACASSNTQTTNIPSTASSSKKSTMTIGEYLANDKKPIILFEVKEIDKDTPINSAYVFQNGKVTTYNLSIPLGDLAKLDTNKIIDLLEDKYYKKIQKGYEREIEIWKNDYAYSKENIQEFIGRLEEFKPQLDNFGIKSFPYIINLETDSSGNSTSLEHLKFERIEIKYDPRIDAEGHMDMGIRTSSNIITVHSYAGTYSIYDASFAAFHVPDSSFTKFLITPVKNEITFELDQPTTKLKSITID